MHPKYPFGTESAEMDLTCQAFCPKFFIPDAMGLWQSCQPTSQRAAPIPCSSKTPWEQQEGAQPHVPTKTKPFLAAGAGAPMEGGWGSSVCGDDSFSHLQVWEAVPTAQIPSWLCQLREHREYQSFMLSTAAPLKSLELNSRGLSEGKVPG